MQIAPPAEFHQMVWIDHRIARIYAVTRDGLNEIAVIRAPEQARGHVHHRSGTPANGHVQIPAAFLQEVTARLQDAGAILVVGPGEAKHALKAHIAAQAPLLDRHIIGVEPMGDCRHRQLEDFATLFFRQADRMGRPPA